MRAQCCICADLFENSAAINIAAVPCGHTFHEECLMRWLQSSSTCPSCRKQVKKNQIIKRLYFDIAEDEEGTNSPDSSKLLNQIGDLKAQIASHGTTRKELEESRENLRACLLSKEGLDSQLKREQQDKLMLRRELASMGKENDVYKQDLMDLRKTQKKLKGLQDIQLMLEGSEHDVSDMVRCHSDGGEAAIKQLCSMVVVVKREYNRAVDEKKEIRDQIRKIKLEGAHAINKMMTMKQEMKKLQLQLKKSNQDVFSLEQENNANRRKIVHLRSALKHNKTVGSQSFIAAVNEDSPNVAYTPTSSFVDDRTPDENKLLSNSQRQRCASPDLFDESVSEEMDNNCENDTQDCVAPSILKMTRIPTAAEKYKAAKQAKTEFENKVAPSVPYSNFSIMQKKLTGVSNSHSSALPKTRVYNGFGGSMKSDDPCDFDTPYRGYLKLAVKRKATKRQYHSVNKPLPNQPKLSECLSKERSARSLTEATNRIAAKNQLSMPPKKKQPFSMSDMFKKSVKSTASAKLPSSSSLCRTSSSSSLQSTSKLSCPPSGIIDLT